MNIDTKKCQKCYTSKTKFCSSCGKKLIIEKGDVVSYKLGDRFVTGRVERIEKVDDEDIYILHVWDHMYRRFKRDELTTV